MKTLLSILIIGLLFGCDSPVINPAKWTDDYCSQCIVGNRYILYGSKWNEDNPFEERSVSDVIIVAKQNGYVQYCWHFDVDKPRKALFSRSCKDFVELQNPN